MNLWYLDNEYIMNLDIEFFLLSLAVWNEALPKGVISLFATPRRLPQPLGPQWLPAKGRKVHRYQPFFILPIVLTSTLVFLELVLFKA